MAPKKSNAAPVRTSRRTKGVAPELVLKKDHEKAEPADAAPMEVEEECQPPPDAAAPAPEPTPGPAPSPPKKRKVDRKEDEPAVAARNSRERSCVHCQSKKLKCDRKPTCSACAIRKQECVYLGQPPEEQDEEAERTQSEVDRLRIIVQLLQERAERAFRAPQPALPPQLAFGNVYTGLKPSRQSMPHPQGMEQAMLASGQQRTRYSQPVHPPQSPYGARLQFPNHPPPPHPHYAPQPTQLARLPSQSFAGAGPSHSTQRPSGSSDQSQGTLHYFQTDQHEREYLRMKGGWEPLD